MDPAVRIYDSVKFPAHFIILLKTIRNQYSLKVLIEFQGMLTVSRLLVFIQNNRPVCVHLPGTVDPHIAFASGTSAIMDDFHRGFISLGGMVFQKLCSQGIIQRRYITFRTADDPVSHCLAE